MFLMSFSQLAFVVEAGTIDDVYFVGDVAYKKSQSIVISAIEAPRITCYSRHDLDHKSVSHDDNKSNLFGGKHEVGWYI